MIVVVSFDDDATHPYHQLLVADGPAPAVTAHAQPPVLGDHPADLDPPVRLGIDLRLTSASAAARCRTVPPVTPDELRAGLRDDRAVVDVRLLVLHGSRARGDARPGSDWDLLLRPGLGTDPNDVGLALVRLLGTDAVDVADLDRASALLRFRAARDGLLLVGDPEEFLRFREDAVRFWCDAGPVIRTALEEVLTNLDRPT